MYFHPIRNLKDLQRWSHPTLVLPGDREPEYLYRTAAARAELRTVPSVDRRSQRTLVGWRRALPGWRPGA